MKPEARATESDTNSQESPWLANLSRDEMPSIQRLKTVATSVGVLITVSGCSPATIRPTIQDVAKRHAPPLVLKIAPANMSTEYTTLWEAHPRDRNDHPTLGEIAASILGAPIVLVTFPIVFPFFEALKATDSTLLNPPTSPPPQCLDGLRRAGLDIPVWASSTWGNQPWPMILEEELKDRFNKNGLTDKVAPVLLAQADWDLEDFQGVAERMGSTKLIIGYVYLSSLWGMHRAGCGVVLDINVSLRAISLDPPNRDIADKRISVVREVMQSDTLHEWANNPDAARAWVRSALAELASKISDLYVETGH